MTATRFAPSPTGRLHVGNVRTALLAWLFARRTGGRFLLRLDDTDEKRSTDEFAQSIRDDLDWLGLVPDAEEKQSDHLARYQAVFDDLRQQGLVYPAYETPEELEVKRKVLLARGKPPVYDREALTLTDADRASLEAAGRKPHWRFRLAPQRTEWDDLVRGPSHIDPASISDPVIRRADGSWLYMLPSVIDDIDMGVTHVIRGEDHVTNTGIQLQMFAALNAPLPRFAHAPLLAGSEGALSKRLGSVGVADFRADGIEAIAVLALLARLGTALPVEPVTSTAPLIDSFDFALLGRATARFDEAELRQLNSHILHLTPYEDVQGRTTATQAEWAIVRANIDTLADADDWHKAIAGPVTPAALTQDDRAVLHRAADLLANLSFDADGWGTMVKALRQETGRKGKALYLPLRQALTGREHGPDLAHLLPLIGREEALARLRNA